MKIYTDFDYVLHNYSVSYEKAIIKYLKISYATNYRKSIFKDKHKRPLDPYIESYSLSKELTEDLVYIANELGGIYKTDCFDGIYDFLLFQKRIGNEVIVITARSTRKNVEKIIHDILGNDTPVITVDTKHKYLAIEDNSIYFEDDPDAIIPVLNNRKNVLVVVPKWPWNIDLSVNDNIIHLHHNEFENISKIICEKIKKEICL